MFLLTKATQRHKIKACKDGFKETYLKKGKTRLNQVLKKRNQSRTDGTNLCSQRKMEEAL